MQYIDVLNCTMTGGLTQGEHLPIICRVLDPFPNHARDSICVCVSC